jgi:hypothetical protein
MNSNEKIKTLALLAIIFFLLQSAVSAGVSIGVNIGLPSIVVSDHYERGYEPKKKSNISRRSVVYENHRHYDDGSCCDDRRYDDRRYNNNTVSGR